MHLKQTLVRMSAAKQWWNDLLSGYDVVASILTRMLYNTAVMLVLSVENCRVTAILDREVVKKNMCFPILEIH